ncbi:MAG: DUF2934 domain-containing protein [Planctomycetia bacterium]|nr:MAG: DUF2934 domain-containing protein [Planctomycetia bacterium]
MSTTVRTRRSSTTNANTTAIVAAETPISTLIAPQASVSRPRTAPAQISHARIEERAYQVYLSRNGGPGDAMSDWLQAERELMAGCAR